MSNLKKKKKRRKRSYSNNHSDDNEGEEPPSKKIKYTDYRRRSDRIKAKVSSYNDDEYYDQYNDESPTSSNSNSISNSNSHSSSNSNDDDQQTEDDSDDAEDSEDDSEIQSDEYDENDENDGNDNDDNHDNHDNESLLFTSHSIRYHRTYRTILNNPELNRTEITFKNKAYQYVNNYFKTNFKNSNQIWIQEKNKCQSHKQEIIKQKQNTIVLPFARREVSDHASFLQNVAQNVAKTSKYLHITGNTVDEQRIDQMISPIDIALTTSTCPIPHSTPYITVNRNHYVKDDKKLRFIPQIGDNIDIYNHDDFENDGDTEFEEQEDILLDYIYENLELDDDETIDNLEKIFYLSFERIQHRIMSLSHHKEKLLKQQKKKLILNGYDTKNKDIPIDSFSLLFCPRCITYDCSLHGLDNPRRKNRELPSDSLLAQNCDYFAVINKEINEQTINDLAVRNGNYSAANHMIEYFLPKTYKPSVTYNSLLTDIKPCNNDCYITFIDNKNQNQNQNNHNIIEWSYMDLTNLRRLLNICKKNFCQIAAILDNVSCTNVYLKAKELIPDLVTYIMEKDNDKKIKKKNAVLEEKVSEKKKEAVELNAENIPHQFFGCKHDGICSVENNCSCLINKTYCEKYCNCNIECMQRFPGCVCEAGHCQTDLCPCFKSHRECDPDKCIPCQSYLTPQIFDESIEWLKQKAPEFYDKSYGKKRKSNDISVCDKEEEDKEEENDENIRIEIGGVPNINPFNLCGNLCCTQQRKKKLWIGKSDIHGFGCFAGENILAGEYITEYLGEMITQHEADRRGRVYDEQNISYLFNLNEEYCIDATRKGSKMKFANHSIKPNCRAKIITVNGDHRICIYAKKDLQVGQELLFDYRHDNVDTAQQPSWFHHNQK